MFSTNKRKLLTVAFVVSVITILIYLPALQNDFVNWDDSSFVRNNANIQSIDLKFLKWIFTTYHTSDWFPMTWFSHAIDYALWGLNPAGHHLTSILFHGLNTFLVVILITCLICSVRKCSFSENINCYRNKKRSSIAVKENNLIFDTSIIAGAVTALLFGLHPLHVESIAWISERKDVLYSFFFLISILSYLKYTSVEVQKQKTLYYCLSLLFFALSLLSKSMAVTLPIVLVILDFYPIERLDFKSFFTSGRKVLIEKIPFLALSIAVSIVTIIANQAGSATVQLKNQQWGYQTLVAFKSLCFYLFKMLWPADLAPLYPYPSEISFFTFEYLGSLIVIAGITSCCVFIWKKQKLWLTLWIYYVITLLPVIGIIRSGVQIAADRYTYLSSLGPFLLVGLGVKWFTEKSVSENKRIIFSRLLNVIIFMAIVFTLLSYLTIKQVEVWKDSITLWSHEIKIFPNSVALAYNNRGNVYRAEGKYNLAIADYNKAIEIKPGYYQAYNNRGITHRAEGKNDLAIADYNKAIEIKPGFYEAYNNRGITHRAEGKYDLAIADYNKAIEINEGYDMPYNNRGNVYRAEGKYDLAIVDYNKAIEINEGYDMPYNNRGNVYRAEGKYNLAIADYNKAIEINPGYYQAYNNRGITHRAEGKYDLAIADYSKAIEINPGYGKGYRARAAAYESMGQYERAIVDLNKAIEINPGHDMAYNNRGYDYLLMSRYAEAERDIKKALELNPDNLAANVTMAEFYSLINKDNDACRWLEKAIEKGFNDLNYFKTYKTFDNIRNSSCYIKIMKGN